MKVGVNVGDQVYEAHKSEAFGAVRHVSPHELTVDIENHGDVTIDGAAVVSVHDGKVVVDPSNLPADVRAAIAGAHRAEDR